MRPAVGAPVGRPAGTAVDVDMVIGRGPPYACPRCGANGAQGRCGESTRVDPVRVRHWSYRIGDPVLVLSSYAEIPEAADRVFSSCGGTPLKIGESRFGGKGAPNR